MNRRAFIKTIAAGTVAGTILVTTTPIKTILAAILSPGPVQLKLKDKLLQGTREGRILESRDAGKTWQPLFNFGSHCAILELVERKGLVYARVGVLQYSFVVQSTDGRTWLTTAAIPA